MLRNQLFNAKDSTNGCLISWITSGLLELKGPNPHWWKASMMEYLMILIHTGPPISARRLGGMGGNTAGI